MVCWELGPPQRPLSMVIDHIVYEVTVTRVVLHGFYPEKSPFFHFWHVIGRKLALLRAV